MLFVVISSFQLLLLVIKCFVEPVRSFVHRHAYNKNALTHFLRQGHSPIPSLYCLQSFLVSDFIPSTGLMIDITGFIFGIHDGLIFIQTVISGQCITDRNCNQIKGYPVKAKQFKGDQHCRHRTVRHSTEQRHHSCCRCDLRRKSQCMSQRLLRY